jgi:hypothetical protein
MYNILVQVLWRILRILISLLLTLRLTTHLNRRRSRRLMTSTYFMEISCHTLSWWVRWPSIRVLAPPVPNMRLLTRHRTIYLARPPECPRHKHRPTQGTSTLAVKFDQETHTVRLSLGEYFVGVDIYIFYFRDCSLYFILFERLYFIFFIYGLKLNFSYLCFEIKFLQSFKIIKHNSF